MRDQTDPETQAERTAAMRQRIIEGTHRVIAESGVPAITFRAVAKAAQVSLGTVSYHFTDKTELMQAAIGFSRDRFRRRCLDTWTRAQAGEDLAICLSELIELLTLTTRDELLVDYELFLAAFHHDITRDQSVDWSQDLFADIGQLTTPERARLVGYFFEGLCLHAAKLGKAFTAAEMLPLFRSLLGQRG